MEFVALLYKSRITLKGSAVVLNIVTAVMIFGTWPVASCLQPHHTSDNIQQDSTLSRVILLKYK